MQAHTTGASTVEGVGVELNDTDEPFAVLTLGHVQIFVYTEADADELIKAACAAKDMLAAHRHAAAMAPLPDRGRYDAASAAEVAEGLGPICGTLRLGYAYACNAARGHEGGHVFVSPTSGAKNTWPNKAAPERTAPDDAMAPTKPEDWDMWGRPQVRECAECGMPDDADGHHFGCSLDTPQAAEGAQGLPVPDDEPGDGDDGREPYCLKCLFTLDAAGRHLYPDDAMAEMHETELGWREPVGRPATTTAEGWDILTGPGTMTAAMAQAYVNTGLNTGLPAALATERDALQAEIDAAHLKGLMGEAL